MRISAGALALLLLATPATAAQTWVASWASAQQIAEPENMIAPAVLTDATLRQVIRLSVGGTQFRVRLSNAFGKEPLHLKAVHVANPAGPGIIDPKSDRALTFMGRNDVIIPAGASYLSDPVNAPLAAGSDLTISIQYDVAPEVQTSHPGSRQTSYYTAGNHVADAALPDVKTADHWFTIAAVDVAAAPGSWAIVTLGDSITDGRGSTTNGNDRWPNVMAQKLLAANRPIAVLNAGIGGNRVLGDGKGQAAVSRFERDVLAQPGVKAVLVLEGVNDLGVLTIARPVPFADHDLLVKRLIEAYHQIAMRAHEHGMKAYIGTIMPFMGFEYYHPDAANEADRNAVNAWIRVQKEFDGVVDFDKLLRDPAHPDRVLTAYHMGDFLHPSPAGHRVMGEAAAKLLLPERIAGDHAVKRPRHKKASR